MQRCADQVIAAVEKYHPGFRDRVDVVDVSMPLTRERYTSNWMGAMQVDKPGSNRIAAFIQRSPRYVVKGVEGLYVADQWAEAWGGITIAAQSGRKTIQAICTQDGVIFKIKKPTA
jgi:phytoene dehydrogenase-like protein